MLSPDRTPSFFVGNAADFSSTRGYILGFFMGDKGYSKLQSDAAEFAIMDLPAINEAPPHFHKKSVELTYCLKGGLRLLLGNNSREVSIRAGDFMTIPAGVPLQNPENDPETQIAVVKAPSVPNDKYNLDWKTNGYSLWLMPTDEVRDKFSETIHALAGKYDSPTFEPHITLVGGINGVGIDGYEDDLCHMTSAIARLTPSLQIQFADFGYQDTFTRSLYLNTRSDEGLMSANHQARQLLALMPDRNYTPHLSLLYGSLTDEEKLGEIAKLGRTLPETFEVRRLDLYKSEGFVRDWKKLAEFPLRD